MGRGRKPKIHEAEPAFVVCEPPRKPPVIEADSVASEEWDRLVVVLTQNRTLNAGCLGLMTSYCSAFSTLVRVKTELAKATATVVSVREGAEKANPLWGVLSGAENAILRYSKALGLTPVDRTRATPIEAAEDRDDLESILAD